MKSIRVRVKPHMPDYLNDAWVVQYRVHKRFNWFNRWIDVYVVSANSAYRRMSKTEALDLANRINVGGVEVLLDILQQYKNYLSEQLRKAKERYTTIYILPPNEN